MQRVENCDDNLAMELGCEVGGFPSFFLGLPWEPFQLSVCLGWVGGKVWENG